MIGENESPFGVAWFILYGYSGVPPAIYMPQLRELGAGFTKVYLFWQQIEPEPGRFDWSALNAFVEQLATPEEGLISIFSASQWATERPSAILPPSPAKDLEEYYRFVRRTVERCRGRVRYWQNDAEPNNPVFWSGTKEQFVAQLRVFYRAVKDGDPDAVVVVGGYDGMFVPPEMVLLPGMRMEPFPQQEKSLAFFDYVLREGGNAFDIFDLRLYGDPYSIVARVEHMRRRMQANGYDKPIICTEYGGPNLFEFRENHQYRELVEHWSPPQDPRITERIQELYANMAALPPQTQMFMLDCPAELDAKYQRIQSRSIVMRNVLALSAGVRKTLYWDLLDVHGETCDLMTLMYAKIGLLGLEGEALTRRTLSADVFARMAQILAEVRSVRRVATPEHESVFLFEVDRGARGPLHVAWERRDAFSGEDLPPRPFDWDWVAPSATATDAFGAPVPVAVEHGRIRVLLSITPLYVEA
ncbi:MAG TPA: hypothetical protein VKU01_35710 [Bryobacteraceae bacterium]|nr:hypothetical protein [Bryobacteraceae bacterium]